MLRVDGRSRVEILLDKEYACCCIERKLFYTATFTQISLKIWCNLMANGVDQGHIFFKLKRVFICFYSAVRCKSFARSVMFKFAFLKICNCVLTPVKIDHLRPISNCFSQGNSQSCFQCTFPSSFFFSVAPKIFNKSLEKWAKSWKGLTLSCQIWVSG